MVLLKSPPLLTGVSFVGREAVGLLADRLVRRLLVGCGLPSDDRDQGHVFRQPGSALRLAGRGQRLVSKEFPSGAILVDTQSMTGRKMPFEHLTAPAALEADNIIAVNGATDRYRVCSLDFSFGRRCTEADERLMHGRD